MTFLTSYRPNFCSECGEKIVRLRWRVWTSRQFCDNCAARFAKTVWSRRACAAIVFACLVIVIGRSCRHEPPPLVIHRTVTAPSEGTANTQPAVISEQSYICGAKTKKGAPCSRRVRGPVRCWQHKGAPAMLPPEKLIVKD